MRDGCATSLVVYIDIEGQLCIVNAGRVHPWLIHDPVIKSVNDTQIGLLKQFLYAVANDPVAIADLDSYGKSHDHLSQLMADHCIQQLSLSPRQLHPTK